MIILDVRDLQKSYGTKKVFSDISFAHETGSLGIAGSNGSGKSTFLKCLGSLLQPSQGQIVWKEEGRILEKTSVQQRLGYAAPYINLYDELTCRENLEFLSEVRHEDIAYQLDEWIQRVGLSAVADQPFGTLSTGQQQRLRIASALFHEPDILLLDEPGSNLDEAGRSFIASITEDLNAAGTLIVLASNNPEELALCDRVYSVELEAAL